MKLNKTSSGIFGALGLLLLILDSKTAISGVQEGIQLCLQTVVPALFPFFIVSSLSCQSLMGRPVILLTPLRKLCRIPKGAESLLLLGFLGGYPVGARNIALAEMSGAISKEDAHRMLGYCNNAGPAFIFGMTGYLFTRNYIPWVLWLIHILSAIIVGYILPGKTRSSCQLPQRQSRSFVTIMESSVKTMGNVCGWVIIFRVILSFFRRWFFFLLPIEIQVWITGLTELSNGVIALQAVSSEGLRFILCASMLGFGGLCVGMQTISITGSLRTGYYFPGKILQGCISILLAYACQLFLLPSENILIVPAFWLLIPVVIIVVVMLNIHPTKNNSRNLSQSYV